MIRAVYRKGKIQPVDAVPDDWADGQELMIEPAPRVPTPEDLAAWSDNVAASTAEISDEEHDRFMAILAEIEAESKELGRREMERSG
jgi:hypothetical protein